MRPIDADALKVRMFRSNEFNRDTGSFDLPVVPWHDIEDADTLDFAPIRHGEWEQKKHKIFGNTYEYVCSVCGCDYALAEYKYCPNCGAKMDGGKKDV